MSKCWYCNDELTTGNNPNHFGICNKCYDEMFKSGDVIIRSLTNKIAELQKQLEEKERLLQYGKTEIKKLHKRINDIVKRDEKLFKSQPAEIVKKIKKAIKDSLVFPDGNLDCSFKNDYSDEITLCSVMDKVLKEYQK